MHNMTVVPTWSLLSMSKALDKYQRLESAAIHTVGYTFEELVDLFAKGYTLEPPADRSLSLADLAEREI